jgi:hypothetical protein
MHWMNYTGRSGRAATACSNMLNIGVMPTPAAMNSSARNPNAAPGLDDLRRGGLAEHLLDGA